MRDLAAYRQRFAKNILNVVKDYMAVALILQNASFSAVAVQEHTELAWILNVSSPCHFWNWGMHTRTRLQKDWSRMRALQLPMLMAADILLYDTMLCRSARPAPAFGVCREAAAKINIATVKHSKSQKN